MTEIGLILLGVIVVGGLLAFFLLRTKRGGETQTGPRTVADLVRLKAEESGAVSATPAAPPPPSAPKDDVVGTEGSASPAGSASEPAAAAQPSDPTPSESPAATTSGPADSAPAAGSTAATGAGAAVAAGGVAVAGAAAAAGRGAAASPAAASPAALPAATASPAAAAAGPSLGLPQPRPRTPEAEAPAAPSAPAAVAAEPELEPEAAPAGPVDRGDVSPPWDRIPDGSLVLPAAGPVESTPSNDQPDWRWLAPVGDRRPAARTTPTAPPAPAGPTATGTTARHAAGRGRPPAVPGSAGASAAGTPDLPAPRPVTRTVRLTDPVPDAAPGSGDQEPAAATPATEAPSPTALSPTAPSPKTPSTDGPAPASTGASAPIGGAGRATAWFEPTRPADDAIAPQAGSSVEKAPDEPSSKAPSVAAIVAGAAAAAGGVVVGLRPRSEDRATTPDPDKALPAEAEPAEAVPAKAEPAKAEPAEAAPAKAEPAEADAATPQEPAKPAEQDKVEPDKAEPKQAEPKQAEPERAEAAAPGSAVEVGTGRDTTAPVVATGASIASLVTRRAGSRPDSASPEAPETPEVAAVAAGTDADALAGFSDWADIDDSENDESVERPVAKDPTPAFGLAAVTPAPAPTTEPTDPTGTTAPTEPASASTPEPAPVAASAGWDDGSVRFRVVGRDGEALTGATVRLLDGRGQGLAEATAGDDGRGALTGPSDGDADGFVVVASAAGHQPTVTTISGEASGEEIALVLATSSAVAGRVRDASGRPVGGASVSLIEEGEVVDSTRTAATGDYRIDDLPSGEYTIAVTAPRHDPVAAQVKVEPGATATHDVVLDPVSATLGG
ncbi:carboxypeptidase regulatory-like domain-containing protein [Pseudonocardia sulfidoxydans]|nr:carboxypeptidase-like regulatory domain-containing protein [Pseudonocardia sulfidoxydans]